MRSRCILHMSPYQEVIIFLSAWGRFPCFPFGMKNSVSFPLLKTEVSCQTDLLRSIVTLKNVSSHFFSAVDVPCPPWVWFTSTCLRCMKHSAVLCSELFESSLETHASVNQKGCSRPVHSTPHLIWVLSSLWYVTRPLTFLVCLLPEYFLELISWNRYCVTFSNLRIVMPGTPYLACKPG